MRILLLVVALLGAACGSSPEAPAPVPERTASERTPSGGTASEGTAPERTSAYEAVTRRATSALAGVGVTHRRATPSYETESNTSVEGTWRGYPVQVYVVPTASLPGPQTKAWRPATVNDRWAAGRRGAR